MSVDDRDLILVDHAADRGTHCLLFRYFSDISIVRQIQAYVTFRPQVLLDSNNDPSTHSVADSSWSVLSIIHTNEHQRILQCDREWKNFLNTCKSFQSSLSNYACGELKRQTIYISLNHNFSTHFLNSLEFQGKILSSIANPSLQLELRHRYLRAEFEDPASTSPNYSKMEEASPSNKKPFVLAHSLQLFYCLVMTCQSLSQIRYLTISYCQLKDTDISPLRGVYSIHFIKCDALTDVSCLVSVQKLQITKCRLISGLEHLRQLKSLLLNNGNMREIAVILSSLLHLEELVIEGNMSLTSDMLESFLQSKWKKKRLILISCPAICLDSVPLFRFYGHEIGLQNYSSLTSLAPLIDSFESLQSLHLSTISPLQRIDNLPPALKTLTLSHCELLEEIEISMATVQVVVVQQCRRLSLVKVSRSAKLRLLEVNQLNNHRIGETSLARGGNLPTPVSMGSSISPLTLVVEVPITVVNVHHIEPVHFRILSSCLIRSLHVLPRDPLLSTNV